ncbi:MAG TPA: diguanylate cyclase, partial [Anaerovoracaceae bacterium]|nr:diguanylate cyclase [Anaerovoracaceae bacterium]
AILLNDKETDAFIKQALLRFVILMIFTMAVILSGIFYIVARYRALLTFQIERNQEIERFTKNVSMIPEITYKCKIQNDELMLTYNYGKSILEDQKISLESTYRPMKKIYSDEYVKTFGEQVEEVFRGASKRFEITYKDGHYEHFVSPIFDKDGTVIEIIGIANNITDRRIAEEQSKYLATHDFLTDLWNRRTFEDEVKKRIYSTYDESYAIMIIDLDNFKRVNDSYGHIAGDLMLKYAANCIRNAVKKESASSSSVIARMGGDEFAVFLPYTNLQEVDDTAKHIVNAIFEPHMVRGRSIQIGASVGIALYSKDSRHYKQLTYYADVAMYQAKKSKIGGYRFFKRSMLLHE